MAGWVGPRADLNASEKRTVLLMPLIESRLVGHPVLAKALYRLKCIFRFFQTVIDLSSFESTEMSVPDVRFEEPFAPKYLV
jgi:hypothetical protein